MALFQKQPITNAAPLYTMGESRRLLVVGLGNVGKKYDGTRHNVGFAAADLIAVRNEFPAWTEKKDLKTQVNNHMLGGHQVILLKPTTMMNNSGEAVSAAQRFWKIANTDTVVIYDELAIPFGSLRSRRGGESAGHNGINSIISHCGEDFGRVRVGIGNEISQKADSADFVLGRFTKSEQESLPLILKEVNALISEYVFGGQLPHETRQVL